MAPQPPQTQPVSFHDGATRLAGELSTPAGRGPHPAVAMIHGSGAADRTNLGVFPPIRDHLVAHGIAVLCFDKPGTGGSTGDWTRQSFPGDRVAEALAAVAFLSGRAEVIRERIGLLGVSQGGWVVPLAASKSSTVDFVVTVSGPGVSPAVQNVHDVETSMRADGHPAEDVRRGGDYVRALMRAARDGLSYDEIRPTILEPAAGAPWTGYFDVTSADQWEFLLRSDSTYDPTVALEQLSCPILAIFGADDPRLPVADSVTAFEQALRRAANPDVTIEVFAGADHQLRVAGGDAFVPGYLELVSDWLRRVTRRAPRRS